MTYLALKTLHLLAAATFIGSLFFQIFVLWPASRQLPAQSLSELDQSVRRRFMLVIHLVALVLYGAGFGLLTNYWKHLLTPFSSNFSMLLSLKLILAFSIIVHYLALAATRRRAPVGPGRPRARCRATRRPRRARAHGRSARPRGSGRA